MNRNRSKVTTPHREVCLYLGDAIDELHAVAEELGTSVSRLLVLAWEIARAEIRALPGSPARRVPLDAAAATPGSAPNPRRLDVSPPVRRLQLRSGPSPTPRRMPGAEHGLEAEDEEVHP